MKQYNQLIINVILLSLLVLCFGCSRQTNSQIISAMTEEGYTPNGQSVSIGPLPHSEEVQPLPDIITIPLKAALTEHGYVMQEQGTADVHVRVYWQSVGPFVTIKENPLWDFGFGSRGPWQRDRFIKEEKFLRTLVVEAWNNDVSQGEVLAPFLQKPLNYEQALAYLPAKPARLLWRVQARNIGRLSNIDGVLPELINAALPWIGRSINTQVIVQEDLGTYEPTK